MYKKYLKSNNKKNKGMDNLSVTVLSPFFQNKMRTVHSNVINVGDVFIVVSPHESITRSGS